MDDLDHRFFSRRDLLRTAVGGTALGVVGMLPACGSSQDDGPAADDASLATSSGSDSSAAVPTTANSTTGSAATGSGVLPAHVEQDIVAYDLPAGVPGVPPVAFAYPTAPVDAQPDPPTSGGSISMMKIVRGLPPGVDKNPFWQELNKRVGAKMEYINLPNAGYWSKVATTVAGGDLPDIIQLNRASTVPSHLPDLLDAKFQDLSEWLSGDAVKEYPNLAALPTSAWQTVVFDDKIYGIPWPQSVLGNDNKIRQDIVDELGLSTNLRDGQDFLSLCQGLTDPGSSRWAIDTVDHAFDWVAQMSGVPNQWQVEDGKFTSAYTTDEYKQALDVVRGIWKAGYVEPDSLATPGSARTWFLGGRVAMMGGGYDRGQLWGAGLAQDPKFAMGEFILPKWPGGGQAAHWEIKGAWTFAALKKAGAARVQELLNVANWFASPFGTKEYLFTHYGLPGRHYALDGSDPIETPNGVNECQNMAVEFLASPPPVYYLPRHPEAGRTMHAGYTELMKVTAPLPTRGLTAPTRESKGGVIDKALSSAQTDIMVGRKPLSSWDGAVKSWLDGGGTAIGHEYEEAHAKANS